MNETENKLLIKSLHEINETLNDQSLNFSQEDRLKLKETKALISTALLSSWLPIDTTRKVTMIILFIVGLYGIINSSIFFIIFWIPLPFFSPRIVEKVAMFFGKINGNK